MRRDLCLLGDLEGVIHLDAQVSHSLAVCLLALTHNPFAPSSTLGGPAIVPGVMEVLCRLAGASGLLKQSIALKELGATRLGRNACSGGKARSLQVSATTHDEVFQASEELTCGRHACS